MDGVREVTEVETEVSYNPAMAKTFNTGVP